MHINAITTQRPFCDPNHWQNFPASTWQANQLCGNCVLTWSATHKEKCIAKGKTCIDCGLQTNFCRVCRKPKSASSKLSRSKVNSIDGDTTDKSVNANQNTIYNSECGTDYDSLSENMVASIGSNILQIEPKNNPADCKYKSRSPHRFWVCMQHFKEISCR